MLFLSQSVQLPSALQLTNFNC